MKPTTIAPASRSLSRAIMISSPAVSSASLAVASSSCCMVPPPPIPTTRTSFTRTSRAFSSPSNTFSTANGDNNSCVGRKVGFSGTVPSLTSSSISSSSTTSLSSFTKHFSTLTTNDDDDESSISSARGRRAVSLLPVYLTDARSVTRYDPITAPDGALQLSVAENQMLEDLLLPALTRFSSSSNANQEDTILQGLFQANQIYYQPTHGRPGLREAIANYLQRLLRIPSRRSLDREGLVCGAGCNAVLENLCFCLTEPGDAVLLPTPYYAAFEFDLVARAGLNIVPVNTMAHQSTTTNNIPNTTSSIPKSAYYPSKASLDAAYEQAKSTGSQPKILLLSHPNNPLGISYPAGVIQECIDWANERKVHLVSDEIYAGSVYRGSTTDEDTMEEPFQSALALATAAATPNDNTNDNDIDNTEGLGLGPYVHFVYALSKDFALSGLRVGVAYSENKAIRLPLQKLNDLCQISSQTQCMVERMLSAKVVDLDDVTTIAEDSNGTDDGLLWSTDAFLPQNQERIRHRCDRLQQCLIDMGIPHLNANSGMFVWMDLSEFLPPISSTDTDGPTQQQQQQQQQQHKTTLESEESKDQRERTLYLELLHTFGLLFTPGRSMRNEVPGFFRCVFTAASDHEFDLSLERIQKFVTLRRS